jgi:hypothetical protein
MFGGSDGKTNLIGWSNTDWAQRYSISLFIFNLAGSYVSWSSKKQPTVALSTAKAEYMAASNATKEAIWLWTLLKDLRFPPTTATTIYVDNQACVALAHNPVAHSHTKHIHIHHHFICECVTNHKIDLKYCSTKDMLANIFTKQLPHDAFEKFQIALRVGEYWGSHQVGVTRVVLKTVIHPMMLCGQNTTTPTLYNVGNWMI